MNRKILLVGTVSNVAKTIEKELKVVLKALSIFDFVEVFLVESDSTDDTVKILSNIKLNNSNFKFITLGKLKGEYPNRIERIAYCRNIYVKYIREQNDILEWSYIAIADLDGMNFKLSKKFINSCFVKELNWDGVMANQKFGYYDIYALRAKNWVEQDCFYELEINKKKSMIQSKNSNNLFNAVSLFIESDKLRKKYIYQKMKKITMNSEWVKVNSAFGGFAIYKPWIFKICTYGTGNGPVLESEHVGFHECATKKGAAFYINPKLINNYFNPYNLNKFRLVRLLRMLKSRL